jgi:uncharacterized membrane protein YphA (DoxX/SURF4 family)
MNTTLTATNTSSKLKTIGLWTLQILGAVAFLAAGGFKLAGAPMMVHVFDQIGIGQWFRLVTGIVEVTGGVMLLIPRVAGLGGLLLAITMACATGTHLFVIGGNPVPAIVLLLITATVAWARRSQLAALAALAGRR